MIINFKHKNDFYLEFINLNKNTFIINNLDEMKILNQAYINAVSGKLETTDIIIEYQENDTVYDKTNWKIIHIPSLMELNIDLINGKKGVLKSLFKIVLENSLFQNEQLNMIYNLISGIDINSVEVISTIKECFDSEENKINFFIEDKFIDYLVDNLSLRFMNKFDEENLYLLSKEISNLYFAIIDLFNQLESKHLLFIFNNPFISLNTKEILDLSNQINKLDNYIIFLSNSCHIEIKNIENSKIIAFNNIIDIAKIIDDPTEYLEYFDKPDKNIFLENLFIFIQKYLSLNILYYTKEQLLSLFEKSENMPFRAGKIVFDRKL
ncbi:hypothetical protein [Spiroplasma alleghenense]|uniref:Uncharacterized protein n=1 Tax=Spiroplasma alleghenense TaxID=216931 RepID=A0A345Z4S5_9MOLU|nr:hypothetical protein [Spiroplasma alleghenense]AXK51604.1 hypothetical protein SALLE_v1c09340 [Spiroplasma alleghenense]